MYLLDDDKNGISKLQMKHIANIQMPQLVTINGLITFGELKCLLVKYIV